MVSPLLGPLPTHSSRGERKGILKQPCKTSVASSNGLHLGFSRCTVRVNRSTGNPIMIDPLFLLLLLWIPMLVVVLIPSVVIPRIRMRRRVKALLAQMPHHELRKVYLAFASGWRGGKGREMEARIAGEEKSGWTFLEASEANPFKTIRAWGGGVNLHFIRKPWESDHGQ